MDIPYIASYSSRVLTKEQVELAIEKLTQDYLLIPNKIEKQGIEIKIMSLGEIGFIFMGSSDIHQDSNRFKTLEDTLSEFNTLTGLDLEIGKIDERRDKIKIRAKITVYEHQGNYFIRYIPETSYFFINNQINEFKKNIIFPIGKDLYEKLKDKESTGEITIPI